ncbi:hypothetical protein [Virgibacillus sp. L01]|uniref:hypothetical protein n=1 Tax=Virgibacillus sp. L01 TaxID=3457429 RepID=UPI003FD5FF5B
MDDIFINLVTMLLVIAIAILIFKGIYPVLLSIKSKTYPKGRLFLIISVLFILSVVGFFLTNVFTIDPDVVSGNGNPALLIIIPLVPVFIIFNLFLGIHVYTLLRTKFKSYVFMALSIFFIIIFTWGEIELAEDFYTQINVADQSFFLNQYTNTVYFNLFTFLIVIFTSIFISAICSLKKS